MDLISLADSMGTDVIDLDSPYVIELNVSNSSKGNQYKWYNSKTDEFIKQQLLYQGKCWKDYAVEVLVSDVCKASGILGIVEQRVVNLSNGYKGCCSKNFCSPSDGKFIPIKKLVDEDYVLSMYGWCLKIFNYLLDVAGSYSLDWNAYLCKMIILDFLFANEDRHLNNFGFIRNESNLKEAPLFDFGIGLFEHTKKYENKELQSCISLMEGKPFSYNLEAAVNMVLKTDNYEYCKELIKSISIDFSNPNIPSTLAKEYLQYAYNLLKKKIGL